MKKFKTTSLIAFSLVLIAATLLFVTLFNSNQNEKYEQITSFLNTNPAAVVTLRSVLGDVDMRPGDNAEIIIQLNAFHDDALEDRYELMASFLDENADFFIEQASSLRAGLDFQSLTLTLYYDAEGTALRRSFDAR